MVEDRAPMVAAAVAAVVEAVVKVGAVPVAEEAVHPRALRAGTAGEGRAEKHRKLSDI
jgi:hypothetical protein